MMPCACAQVRLHQHRPRQLGAQRPSILVTTASRAQSVLHSHLAPAPAQPRTSPCWPKQKSRVGTFQALQGPPASITSVPQGLRVEVEASPSACWMTSPCLDRLLGPLLSAPSLKLSSSMLLSAFAAATQRCASACAAVKVTLPVGCRQRVAMHVAE